MIKNIFLNKPRIFLLLAALIVFASCSTSPKNPEDIYQLRAQAEGGIEAANKEAAKGNFSLALTLLTNYKRNAVLTDDSSLIIRVCLARGNILFSLGRTDEAFTEWEQALAEARRYNNAELLSIAEIFKARGNLLSNRVPAGLVLEEVTRESRNIRTSRQFIAFSWQVRSLALRSLGSYTEAEEAAKRSLDIHGKDRLLENASYDWYIIASVRSLAGNYDGALHALNESIALDRRIENSWGIASGYRAMGDVYRRAGKSTEANEAYERAKAIYIAMGNESEASEINKRLMN